MIKQLSKVTIAAPNGLIGVLSSPTPKMYAKEFIANKLISNVLNHMFFLFFNNI